MRRQNCVHHVVQFRIMGDQLMPSLSVEFGSRQGRQHRKPDMPQIELPHMSRKPGKIFSGEISINHKIRIYSQTKVVQNTNRLLLLRNVDFLVQISQALVTEALHADKYLHQPNLAPLDEQLGIGNHGIARA